MNKVYIVPVGNVDSEVLTRIVPCLEERFLFQFKTLPAIPVPPQAFNSSKKRYLTSIICENIRDHLPFDAKYLLGITDVDTFEDSSSLLYNFSNPEDIVALVSTQRFNFRGDREVFEKDIFFQRILKETTHEIGHLMGFRHCFNNYCVMYFSYSINDTDKKEAFFCHECEKKLNMIQNS